MEGCVGFYFKESWYRKFIFKRYWELIKFVFYCIISSNLWLKWLFWVEVIIYFVDCWNLWFIEVFLKSIR